MTVSMLNAICKAAVLVMSGLLVLAPVYPVLAGATFIVGLVVLASAIPCLSHSYKKPVYFFLTISIFLGFKYQLSSQVLVSGINSMLPIVAIMAVLQIFIIPIKVGQYDVALKQYLQSNFKKESTLYLFMHLVTHLLGSLLSLGSIPVVFSIFHESIKRLARDSSRFTVTAVSRGFALSTFWAPGAVSVMLALQVTGAPWFSVFLPAIGLAALGIVTSILLDVNMHMRNRPNEVAAVCQEDCISSDKQGESKKKAGTLVLIAAALLILIVIMEQIHILTTTTRILAAGLIVTFIWALRYFRYPGMYLACREYWGKTLNMIPDLAALFIAIGVFSEVVDQAGLTAYSLTVLMGNANLWGQYSLLLVPPVLILMSLTGIHPFISLLLLGKIIAGAIHIPHHDVLIALSLLLGGVISYTVSPLAGTVLILSKLVGCSPGEVAIKWNGLFSLVFLLEGLAVIFLLELFWR